MPKKSAKGSKPSQEHPLEKALIEHAPPHSLEAEKGVIGAILILPITCDEVIPILRPEDFYSEANRKLYRHLTEMHGSGSGIDLTLLLERLERSGDLEATGGEAYLGEVMSEVQVAAHAVQYAEIVRDRAILRDLIQTSAEILRSAYEPIHEPKDIVNRAEEKIFAITDARSDNQVHPILDVINETFKILDNKAGGEVGGVATGFHKLDELTGGLHPDQLVILAARPGIGKTALALNIADHAAVAQNKPTLVVSLEMGRVELAMRLLSARGRLDAHKMRSNFLASHERQILMKSSNELSASPLFIDDPPSRSVTEIGSLARRLKRQDGLELIVIDYLGLIEPDMPTDPRQEQVAKIARRLKGLARELHVPVLCLAQLNRQADAKDTRPRLSHLRESGAIEQDADVVMFIHREEAMKSPEEADLSNSEGRAELILAKQRNGPTGDIPLLWFKQFTRFDDPSNRQDESAPYDEFGSYDPGQQF